MSAPLLRGALHHLCIDFHDDGEVNFFSTTDDPADLVRRFAALIRVLLEHPTAVGCAAGHHEEHGQR